MTFHLNEDLWNTILFIMVEIPEAKSRLLIMSSKADMSTPALCIAVTQSPSPAVAAMMQAGVRDLADAISRERSL